MVRVWPFVAKVPLSVTLLSVLGSAYVRVKLPPVTWVLETVAGEVKQGLEKVPVPVSRKFPSASEAGDWLRAAVMLRTSPLAS